VKEQIRAAFVLKNSFGSESSGVDSPPGFDDSTELREVLM